MDILNDYEGVYIRKRIERLRKAPRDLRMSVY